MQVQELEIGTGLLKYDSQETILILKELSSDNSSQSHNEANQKVVEKRDADDSILVVSDLSIRIYSNDLKKVLFEE